MGSTLSLASLKGSIFDVRNEHGTINKLGLLDHKPRRQVFSSCGFCVFMKKTPTISVGVADTLNNCFEMAFGTARRRTPKIVSHKPLQDKFYLAG